MSIFNKVGTEFKYLVKIPVDPKVDPTYTHPFPVLNTKKNIVETRWSTKVRPIKDLTTLLRGAKLKRYIDYMVDYKLGHYEYWFLTPQNQLFFSIITSGMTQSVQQIGNTFDVLCPHCNNTFPSNQITWV